MVLFHGVRIALGLHVWHRNWTQFLLVLAFVHVRWESDLGAQMEGKFLSGSDMKPFAGRCQHSIDLPWRTGVI